MNVLASRYKETAASAFGIFRLVQVNIHSLSVWTVSLYLKALAIAVVLSYAGSVNLQWQLLIIVIILFLGTLGFLLVLFDNTSNGISMSVTIQENNNENASCQYSTASSFGQ